MRLLKKSTANMEREAERRSQIEEGVTIARKIDALRATHASLEEQHRKFIDGMKKDLEEQTKPLFDRIASLRLEIQRLEDYKNGIKVPEMERIKKMSKELKDRLLKVKIRERELTRIIKEKK